MRAERCPCNREEISADFGDGGLQDLAVGAQDEHLVAVETERDGDARTELAGKIAIGQFGVIFADILRAVYFDHNRLASGTFSDGAF